MNWHAYQLLFRLGSPLHVGWRREGNCWRCRPYLPAYPLLCALAARLTESGRRFGGGHDDPYHNALAWLEEHVRFTYFFLALPDDGGDPPQVTVFLPCYRKDGSLTYRRLKQALGGAAQGQQLEDLPAAEFDYLFLDAQARTALSCPERTALTGHLYHFEFLCPHTREHKEFGSPRPAFLIGYCFFDEEAQGKLFGTPASDDKQFAFLFDWLQVGGERRLGWGLLRLADGREVSGGAALFGLAGVELELAGGIGVKAKDPIPDPIPVLAHTLPSPRKQPQITGPVEVVLRRETRFDKSGRRRSGMKVVPYGSKSATDTEARPLFLPGSRLKAQCEFTITPEGLWQPN